MMPENKGTVKQIVIDQLKNEARQQKKTKQLSPSLKH
jgi:hypothetical protein